MRAPYDSNERRKQLARLQPIVNAILVEGTRWRIPRERVMEIAKEAGLATDEVIGADHARAALRPD